MIINIIDLMMATTLILSSSSIMLNHRRIITTTTRTVVSAAATLSSSSLSFSPPPSYYYQYHHRRRQPNQQQRRCIRQYFHQTSFVSKSSALTDSATVLALTKDRINGVMEAFPTSSSSSTATATTTTTAEIDNTSLHHDSSSSDPSFPAITKTQMRRMKVGEMRNLLTLRGLQTDGRRDVLLTRLLASLKDYEDDDNNNNDNSVNTNTTSTTIRSNQLETTTTATTTTLEQDTNTNTNTSEPATISTTVATPNSNVMPKIDPNLTYRLRVKGTTTQNSSGAGIGLVLLGPPPSTSSSGNIHDSNDNNNILWEGRIYVTGNRTNFEAEYTSVIIGIKYVAEIFNIEKLIVQISHEAVVHQINGIYDINKPSLRTMMDILKKDVVIKHNKDGEEGDDNNDNNDNKAIKECIFEDIPSSENEIANSLATKALATRKSVNIIKDFQINDPIDVLKEQISQEHYNSRKNTEDSSDFFSTTTTTTSSSSSESESADSDKSSSSTTKHNDITKHRYFKADEPAHHEPIDPTQDYLLRFDGGSRGNPGVAGAGMVLYDSSGKEIWCGWKYHDESATNNVAEYLGLVYGLKCAKSFGITKLIVEGDSQLVVRQISGEYRCREATLRTFRDTALDLIEGMDYFELRHIPRAENSRADWLANHAMDIRESHGFE